MKKRALSLLMTIVLVLSLLPSVAIPALAWNANGMGGSGTAAPPYQVDSAAD